MGTKTINGLTTITNAAAGDYVPVWVAGSGVSRKITKANFLGGALTGGGTIDTNGFTLTVPATGTAALWSYGSSWTPALAFGGGSTGLSYAARSGKYAIIGDTVVIAAFAIALSAKGSSTGNATISGLPVAGASNNFASVFWRYLNQLSTITGPLIASVAGGGTSLLLAQLASGNNSNLTDANFGNLSAIEGIVMYFK